MTEQPQVVIELPFPPSTNQAYRVRNTFTRGGGRGVYMTTEAKHYKADAQMLARQAMLDAGMSVTSKPVLMYLDLVPPSNHRWDLDNRHKLIQDALEGIVYHDDSQIIQKLTTKHPKHPDAGAWVGIYVIDEWEPSHPARRFTQC